MTDRKHDDIVIPDPTRDGSGRAVLRNALGLHFYTLARRHAAMPDTDHTRDSLKREALDAHALLKLVYPGGIDERYLDKVLAEWPELTQEGNDASG